MGYVCHDILPPLPVLLLTSSLGCSLLFVTYWGSKPAPVSVLVLGLGEGLTSIKRMPQNTFGYCRAEMTPQSGLGYPLPCARSSLTVTCPLLEFLMAFPPPSLLSHICLRHTPHCPALLEDNAAALCSVSPLGYANDPVG